ncbi:MAG TPA: alpha/beta fold hydrolase [Acidimicrobiales bacterium]|nr:alpha/beta fold hydrolase [Acidimicrobiales bacterium]
METKTTSVTTPDGRTLCVESGGDIEGPPVLVHGGTPNSRHLAPPWLEDAERRGVHLVSYDRPGYGGSTAQPGRSVADCAADVRSIAEALNIDRLAVWGISGGGPHALACAALLPDLVSAVASLASLAPYGAPGLDYFTGMGQANLDDIKLFFDDPVAAREKSARDRDEFLAGTPEQVQEGMASLLSETDAAVMSHELASFMVTSMQDGLVPGDQGWWDDSCAHLGPWGFAFDAIRVPVQLWHGVHDQFVPFQHGQWLAAQIPGVDAHLTDTDGHLTLMVNRVPAVHEWLLQHR